jgi:RecB family endonuclease NucS
MKEMTHRIKVHKRQELLHGVMDVAAYIREHPEMIQRAVTVVWNEQACALKTVADILNSYKI